MRRRLAAESFLDYPALALRLVLLDLDLGLQLLDFGRQTGDLLLKQGHQFGRLVDTPSVLAENPAYQRDGDRCNDVNNPGLHPLLGCRLPDQYHARLVCPDALASGALEERNDVAVVERVALVVEQKRIAQRARHTVLVPCQTRGAVRRSVGRAPGLQRAVRSDLRHLRTLVEVETEVFADHTAGGVCAYQEAVALGVRQGVQQLVVHPCVEQDTAALLRDVLLVEKRLELLDGLLGDVVLQQLVKSCSEHLRGEDIFGRIGGEEFAILLPETSLVAAADVAERLRIITANNILEPGSGLLISLTISIGVAAAGSMTDDIDLLLMQADRALYDAKNTGRNRVCVAG